MSTDFTSPPRMDAASQQQVFSTQPITLSHPNRLAAVAGLFGLRTAGVANARILEVGCGVGGNLLPIAEAFPDCKCVGIEISAPAVEHANRTKARAALQNVEIKKVAEYRADAAIGPFDFIICHNVLSMVAPEKREQLLAAVSGWLAPTGIAYLSYHTNPGWHLREPIRAVLAYHTRQFADPATKQSQVRALLDFLTQALPADRGGFTQQLRQELERLKGQPEANWLPEILQEDAHPLYFHELTDLLPRHGLRYFGEARVSTMLPTDLAPETEKSLRLLAPSQLQTEQYLDFIRNRAFRETLLCRQEIVPVWNVQPDMLQRFNFAGRVIPPQGEVPSLESTEPTSYRSPTGVTVTTTQPLFKAALTILAETFPASLSFDELFHQTRARVHRPDTTAVVDDDRRQLLQGLLRAYLSSDLIDLLAVPFPLTKQVTEKPTASSLARTQAVESLLVTNRRHESVQLHPFHTVLLPLLDGSRDRNGLVDGLCAAAQDGRMQVARNGAPLTDPSAMREALQGVLNELLGATIQAGLVVA